jgi:hypothetical protein
LNGYVVQEILLKALYLLNVEQRSQSNSQACFQRAELTENIAVILHLDHWWLAGLIFNHAAMGRVSFSVACELRRRWKVPKRRSIFPLA